MTFGVVPVLLLATVVSIALPIPIQLARHGVPNGVRTQPYRSSVVDRAYEVHALLAICRVRP